jgi:hypothetical protein
MAARIRCAPSQNSTRPSRLWLLGNDAGRTIQYLVSSYNSSAIPHGQSYTRWWNGTLGVLVWTIHALRRTLEGGRVTSRFRFRPKQGSGNGAETICSRTSTGAFARNHLNACCPARRRTHAIVSLHCAVGRPGRSSCLREHVLGSDCSTGGNRAYDSRRIDCPAAACAEITGPDPRAPLQRVWLEHQSEPEGVAPLR